MNTVPYRDDTEPFRTKPQVRYDIPIPKGRWAVEGRSAELRALILGLKPGVSHEINDPQHRDVVQKTLLKAAKQLGIPVTTRKMKDGRVLVWRVQ